MLAVGRDGLMLPIRGRDVLSGRSNEATVSVHDRKGRRLGTVYLGRIPGQGKNGIAPVDSLDRGRVAQMERAIAAVGLHHGRGKPSDPVLPPGIKRMRHPRRPDQRLKWEWVIDYYHACEYIYKLAEALFSDAKRPHGWARKMCRWLKKKPRGIYRVLHSAAAIQAAADGGG